MPLFIHLLADRAMVRVEDGAVLLHPTGDPSISVAFTLDGAREVGMALIAAAGGNVMPFKPRDAE